MPEQPPFIADFWFQAPPRYGDDITYWFSEENEEAAQLRTTIEELDQVMWMPTFTETIVENEANIRDTFITEAGDVPVFRFFNTDTGSHFYN